MREGDKEFQDQTITKVEDYGGSWAVTGDCGTLCIPKYSQTPKVGDPITYYGRGFGYPVRGVVINGIEVYYSTAAEYEQKWLRDQEAARLNRNAEYAAAKDGFTARINALPAPLQKRLFQFRERSRDFGPDFEGYELATAEMAAAVAKAAELRVDESAEAWFRRFKESSWESQAAIFGKSCDGASGNMASFAIRQAWLLVTQPDLVPKDHGALCILVGCDGFKACDSYMAKHA